MIFLNKLKSWARGFYYSLWFKNEDRNYTNNPSQEYLFIGGAKDGKIIKILDNKHEIVIPNDRYYAYYKRILCTQNARLGIYVYGELLECDILDMLVKNYKK